jgi:hypothetical protein
MINLSQAQTLLENKRRMFGTTEWKVFERVFWLGNKIKSNRCSASQISFTTSSRPFSAFPAAFISRLDVGIPRVGLYYLSLNSMSAFLSSRSFTTASWPSPAVRKAAHKSGVRPYSLSLDSMSALCRAAVALPPRGHAQ